MSTRMTRCFRARFRRWSPSSRRTRSSCSSTATRSTRTRTRSTTGYLTSREWDPPTMVRNCDNHVVQPSSMWTRRAWERAGPFDERGYYFFDFEFYLRLSALGGRSACRGRGRPTASTRRRRRWATSVGKARDYLRFADEFLDERAPARRSCGRTRARAARAPASLPRTTSTASSSSGRAALAVGGARHAPAERFAAVALARAEEPAAAARRPPPAGEAPCRASGLTRPSVSRGGKGHARSQRQARRIARRARPLRRRRLRPHAGGGRPAPGRRDASRSGRARPSCGSRSACGARCAGSTRSSPSATGCRSAPSAASSSGSSSCRRTGSRRTAAAASGATSAAATC